MDREEYQAFSLLPVQNNLKNWFERNYKFLFGGIILILLLCLAISAVTNIGGQGNSVVVESFSPSNAMRAVPTQSPSVAGTTYGFTIEVDCACGGGESAQPDIYFKIFKCEGNEQYPEWKSTNIIQDSYHGIWHNAFQIRYDPGVPQLIFLRLMDLDTFSDDKIMDTYCFNPFEVVDPMTKKEYSLKKCTSQNSYDCEKGFTLNVRKQ